MIVVVLFAAPDVLGLGEVVIVQEPLPLLHVR
jgi:hypothetical protein